MQKYTNKPSYLKEYHIKFLSTLLLSKNSIYFQAEKFKSKLMKTFYTLLIYLLFCQCNTSMHSPKLKDALQKAGKNRLELEKVLTHYAANPQDSLKWQAACFLIENMPGHYTAESPILTYLRQRLDKDAIDYFSRKTMDIFISDLPELRKNLIKKEDIQYISANYLIQHIDASFKLRERFPWYNDITLEDFFRYILPYRIGNERLDLWRDSIQPVLPDKYNINSDLLYDAKEAQKYLEFSYKSSLQFTDTLLGQLYWKIDNECRYLNLHYLIRDRISGIPSAIDYFPHYPNRNGLHYWIKNIDAEKRNSYIEGAPKSKPAKVFRESFESHPIPQKQEDEYIPELFLNPFLCDVTDEYVYSENIDIPVAFPPHQKPHYAYLCVFNNLQWQPTAMGKWKNKKIQFEKMGKGIVYLPVYYEQEHIKPFNYPFILHANGKIEFLKPHQTDTLSLRLERKYPYDGLQYQYSNALTQASIEATNNLQNENFDTLGFLPSKNHYYLSTTLSDTLPAFRYWQIQTSSKTYIAELLFYDKAGKAISPSSFQRGHYAFDGDILTNTLSHKLTVDFGKAVKISRIVCLPRSDGNGIYPDNEYELYYFTHAGWQSLGRKKAKDYFLDYNNLPSGALYWLHNRTSGVEERIFTYQNGRIRFW